MGVSFGQVFFVKFIWPIAFGHFGWARPIQKHKKINYALDLRTDSRRRLARLFLALCFLRRFTFKVLRFLPRPMPLLMRES